MDRCAECGTDHDGYPLETFGGKLRCLRAQAAAEGGVGTVDQIDSSLRDLDAARDAFLFGPRCTGNTMTCHVAGCAPEGCQEVDLGRPSDRGAVIDTEPRGISFTMLVGEAAFTFKRHAHDGLLRLTVDEDSGQVTVRQLGEILAGLKPETTVHVDGAREGPLRSIIIGPDFLLFA